MVCYLVITYNNDVMINIDCIAECGISSCSRNGYQIVSMILNRTDTLIDFYYNQNNSEEYTFVPDQLVDKFNNNACGYVMIVTTFFKSNARIAGFVMFNIF